MVGEKNKEFHTSGGKRRKKKEKTIGQLQKKPGEIEAESNITEDERECVMIGRDIMLSPTFKQSRVPYRRKTKFHKIINKKQVLGSPVKDNHTEEIRGWNTKIEEKKNRSEELIKDI